MNHVSVTHQVRTLANPSALTSKRSSCSSEPCTSPSKRKAVTCGQRQPDTLQQVL